MDYNKDPDATLAIGQLKKFAGLYLARKKIREMDDKLTARIQEMQTGLIDHLIDHGLDTVPLKGGRTIYIRTDIWAKKKNKKITTAQIVEALKKDGLEDFVKNGYSAMSLASHLRELDRLDKPLSKHLAEVIEPNPVSNLIVLGEK